MACEISFSASSLFPSRSACSIRLLHPRMSCGSISCAQTFVLARACSKAAQRKKARTSSGDFELNCIRIWFEMCGEILRSELFGVSFANGDANGEQKVSRMNR